MKNDNILDFDKFEEYLNKQSEAFKSQFAEEERELGE